MREVVWPLVVLDGQRLRDVARTLAVDLATAQVVVGLREAQIPSILLKGPALARLLYDNDELRSYVDLDLLVPPAKLDGAGTVVSGLGFGIVVADAEIAGHRPLHAHEWLRSSDRVAADLHVTLSGAGAPPERAWEVLSAEAEPLLVGGVEVAALCPSAVALQVALHAAHHGPMRRKALEDLERALERLPEETWARAAQAATELDALPAFAAGLTLAPAGASLAGRLDLPAEWPAEVTLRATGAPPLAVGLDWLARTPGLRAKAALVARTVVPTPGALRSWRSVARRRPFGLARAYLSHPFWLAWHTIPSVLALRRARREAR
jgi:Uncharacterised nucleotidyltransferase